MRQITISGNLGRDAELKQLQNGTQVANFSLAVRQNRPHNGQYGTDWFRCAVFGKRAETIEQYYKKGSHVLVTGTLELSEYNGNTQLDVIVSDFDLPARTSQSSQQSANVAPQTNDDADLPF